MLSQFDGVHLLPSLRVAICNMKTKKLVIKNSKALIPAVPNGKNDQKKADTLECQSPARPARTRCHSNAILAACTKRVCSAEVTNLRYGRGLIGTGIDEDMMGKSCMKNTMSACSAASK